MSHTFPAHFSYKEHRPCMLPKKKKFGPLHSLVKNKKKRRKKSSHPSMTVSLLPSSTGPSPSGLRAQLLATRRSAAGARGAWPFASSRRRARPPRAPAAALGRPSSHRAARLPVLLALCSSPWPAHAHPLYDLTPFTSWRARPGCRFPAADESLAVQANGARWRGCDWPTQPHDK
jgi:hypothetical protein